MPKSSAKFDLILLGDPASGKSTHGKALAKRYHLYNLDMGQELRLLAKDPKFKSILDKTTSKGKLAPTKLVRQVLLERIRSTYQKSRGQHILFSGTPKMIGEAKLVAKWLKQHRPKDSQVIVIYLTISKEIMLYRLTHRKEKVRGKQVRRADDDKKAWENRFKYYRENIRDVVSFMKEHYPFIKVSTDAGGQEVNQKLYKIIDAIINKE